MLDAGLEHEQRTRRHSVCLVSGRHLDLATEDVHGHEAIGHVVGQPAIRLEVEQDEGDASLAKQRDLPMAVPGSARLSAQLRGLAWQVEQMLAAGEAFRRSLAQSVRLTSNDNTSTCGVYPASFTTVITIGASNKNDQRASFSNYGDTIPEPDLHINLVAPGVDMCTTRRDGGYYCAPGPRGTSYSAPMVTGVLGLMERRYPDLTSQQMNDRLGNSTDKSAATVTRRRSAEASISTWAAGDSMRRVLSNRAGWALLVLLAVVLPLGRPGLVAAETPPPTPSYAADRILVRFRAPLSDAELGAFEARQFLSQVDYIGLDYPDGEGWFVFRIEDRMEADLVRELLQRDPAVCNAELIPRGERHATTGAPPGKDEAPQCVPLPSTLPTLLPIPADIQGGAAGGSSNRSPAGATGAASEPLVLVLAALAIVGTAVGGVFLQRSLRSSRRLGKLPKR